jgi:hypothetical protein
MPGMNTLTHIVYCLCNNLEQDNLNEEQFVAKQNELLKEEGIIREAIFKTVLSKFDQEEYKKHVAYILRVLSSLSDILNDTLKDGKVVKNPQTVLLQQKALEVVRRLLRFCRVRFVKKSDSEYLAMVEKLNTETSVSFMALFTRAIVNVSGIRNSKQITAIIRFITLHFSSVKQENISQDSFRNQYDKPAKGTIDQVILLLEKMIHYLKEL